MDGLSDRENGRTTELEWLKLLTRYRDELITCPHCGYEYIYGFNEKKETEVCPACGKPKKEVCVLHIGKYDIALELGKKIFVVHTDKYASDYLRPIGIVVANKNNPSVWGIKLAFSNDVAIKDAEDNEKTVAKDGVIPIVKNLKIKFSENVIGEIR